MKSFLPLLFACLLLAGCSKTDTEEITPEPEPVAVPEKVCYLQHVQLEISSPTGSPWSLEDSYTYADKGRLFSQIAYAEVNVAYGSTYVYDSNGRIIREDMFEQYSVPHGYYTYEYDQQGRVASFSFYAYNTVDKKFNFTSRHVCAYANARQLQNMHTYTSSNGREVLSTVTEYTYTNGLMTKATRYNSNKQQTGETTLTYDDKKSFVSALPAYQAVLLTNGFPHEHNIMSQTTTDADGKILKNLSNTKTATYTEKGYPKNAAITFLDGRLQKYAYTYDCD